MEAYATALLYVTPFFMGLVLLEIAYGHFTKKQMHNTMDTISSLSSGLTNVIKDSLGIIFILVPYPYLLKHLAIFEIESTWIVYVLAFIAIDFASYWNHWINHKINIFWNQHIIHHSSEEFNLGCALRQSISSLLGYTALLLIPAVLLGIPYQIIAILTPLHLFAQFWYHTKHIGKLGLLEYIIVTPSQHRVHHAINKEYIDKNLGAIFCAWDRMFGTFQEELDDVPPVYGVLKPVKTWNPILINFQHLWLLIKDAWRTNNWLDKLRIWFMPTGWRPKDVIDKYPITIIKDVYGYTKFKTPASNALKLWSIYQYVMTTVLLLFMFYNFGNTSFDNLLLYGLVIFIGIYGYTTLMDKKKHAIIVEGIRVALALSILFYFEDWFGLNTFIAYGSYIVTLYYLTTIIGAVYFTYFETSKLKFLLSKENN
ncbi:MAG: sterol desaturase family protein [Flavobacteriaceae bacterium]|nr:sterol desaturase family protein [Flavobacteriaceae bacterium]